MTASLSPAPECNAIQEFVPAIELDDHGYPMSFDFGAGLAENDTNLIQNGAELAVIGADNQDSRYKKMIYRTRVLIDQYLTPKQIRNEAKAVQNGAELEPTGAELAENGTDLQAALICYAPEFDPSDHEYPMGSPEEIELTGDHDFVAASTLT